MTNRFSLEGQVAIVTGASRGLGFEMARAIAGMRRQGVDLRLAERDSARGSRAEADAPKATT